MLDKNKLKWAVKRSGLNYKEFAKKADLKYSSLINALNSSKGVNFITVEKIAKVLDEYDVISLESFLRVLTK